MTTPIQFVLNAAAPLMGLLQDDKVTEIMVNGPGRVFVERYGEPIVQVDVPITKTQIDGLVANVAGLRGQKTVALDGGKGHAIISEKLPPNFRIEVQLFPVAVDGPYITIRRNSVLALTLDDYVSCGLLTKAMADCLRRAVRERRNILVAGGTSSGKTTFLNALIAEIDFSERLLTIETVAELLVSHPNVLRLECDEEQGYSAHRLLKSALRSRPDRIIQGEVRGGEAFDWLDLLNTGHPGGLGTLHANSETEALSRLENLVIEGRPAMPLEAIRQRIGSTLDVVVHMHRTAVDGRMVRRVSVIAALRGFDKVRSEYLLEPVFRSQE